MSRTRPHSRLADILLREIVLKRGRRWELLTPTEKLMGHALRRRKLVRFFEAADGRWIEATLDGVLAAG